MSRGQSRRSGAEARKRLLVVGGAGHVGSLLLPHLTAHHDVRILDLKRPTAPGVDHVVADITDYHAVRSAAAGRDALIFLAMGSARASEVDEPAGWRAHLEVAVPGLYTVLRAVHDAKVAQVVFASSLSVFHDWKHRWISDMSEMRADARSPYGLSKRLAEEVCATAPLQWDMSAVALRLALPTPDDEWPRERPSEVVLSVSASNLADAFLAALDHRPPGGYDALLIAGDTTGEHVDSRRTQRVLGWHPRSWPPNFRPRHDPARQIVFGTARSGVADQARDDGTTFLDVLWAEAPFGERGDFLRAAHTHAAAWLEAGLFNSGQVEDVLAAAARSELAQAPG